MRFNRCFGCLGFFLLCNFPLPPASPFLILGIPESEVAAHDIETLYHETQLFALASHLFWGIWAMVQANCSTIDFDYFGYSLLRLAEYRRRRQQVLDEARAYLSQKR